MKFRNPETGEVFDNIQAAAHPFCARHSCFYNNCPLNGAIKDEICERWIENHPHEAARLMGYEVVEECDHNAFSRISVPFGEEEANMDKPLKDWTLGECKAWCEKNDGECPKGCPIERICDLMEQSPAMLDLDDEPRFTEQEVERAKAIKTLFKKIVAIKAYGTLTNLMSYDVGYKVESIIDGTWFPSADEGEVYTLDEIIGGVE